MGSAEVSPGTPPLWSVGSGRAGMAEAGVSLGNRGKENIPRKHKQRANPTNQQSISSSHHRKLPTWGTLDVAGEPEATQPPSEPRVLLKDGAAVGTSKSLLGLAPSTWAGMAQGLLNHSGRAVGSREMEPSEQLSSAPHITGDALEPGEGRRSYMHLLRTLRHS